MPRESAPARRPVKARGALQAPKVAPRRTRIPVYRRRGVQIVAVAVLTGLLALGVLQILDARERGDQRREELRAVGRFDRSLTLIDAPTQTALTEMLQVSVQFRNGEIGAETFLENVREWIRALRESSQSLAAQETPPDLQEVRALYYNSTLLILDAAKTFRVAASVTDSELRASTIGQARSLMVHAASVRGLAQRGLEKVKSELGLSEEFDERLFVDTPIPLPSENAEPPAPAPPGLPAPPAP
ncbi:MAG: hypothetical protein ACRDI1_12030 [Actinomycetota bacterium]